MGNCLWINAYQEILGKGNIGVENKINCETKLEYCNFVRDLSLDMCILQINGIPFKYIV